MIEYLTTVNPDSTLEWLEKAVRPQLTPDVSSYAKGRLRVWLEVEPMLYPPFKTKLALQDLTAFLQLQKLIDWSFDYCLITFSGDAEPVGIKPHRDAGYANYEARSLNVSGTCRFDYWNERNAVGFAPSTHEYNPLVDAPTHSITLQPGDVYRFNCKNLHSASPSPSRWCMNFWKRKG